MNYLKYMISSIILFSFLLMLRSNIAYSSSVVSRMTESTASIWRASTDRRNVDTFDLKVGNQSFSLRYHVNGANINKISADKDNTSILIALSPSTDGTLNIELPRSVIDSKSQGNVNEDYIVFADGQHIDAEQTITNNRLRTLAIDFEKGVNQIEIAGTRIVPEFGQLNGLLLSLSIIGTLAVAMKYRRLGKT
jgi:hypothetical protein